MKPRISPLGFARTPAAPRPNYAVRPTFALRLPPSSQPRCPPRCPPSRAFSGTSRAAVALPDHRKNENEYGSSNARPAAELNEKVTQEEEDDFRRRLQEDKGKQIRTPWHREGSDVPPVARQRSAGAMTKGKLLTTPSRMLKLILPLTTKDTNSDRKDLEPLALLVHPQQPLSYLERLIQAELPTLKKDGKESIPAVYFRAEDSMQGELEPAKPQKPSVSKGSESLDAAEGEEDFEKVDEIRVDGKVQKTGKLSGPQKADGEQQGQARTATEATPPRGRHDQRGQQAQNRKTTEEATALRGGHGEGGVESYSGLGEEASTDEGSERKFVRWSSSTEIGDFIRDAARGQEFAVEIEGAPNDIRVGVPSFNERTYYLRMRLRKTSKKISSMADVKAECDKLAHKGAQSVAMAGFGVLLSWWYVVYYLTFQTDLGWDVMEPVTYLVGLSTLLGGYVWFLYHNREVSYRSAMNFTISRRQSKLYKDRGFDLRKWEQLVEEANSLRNEIKMVANEYDVEWEELEDEKDVKVAEALKKDRQKKKKGGKEDGEGESEGGKSDPDETK